MRRKQESFVAGSGDPASHLIITVHGIRTFGHWQERLAHLFASAADVTVLNYKFGVFSILSFLLPLFRWWVIGKFRRALQFEADRLSWTRVDIVAHSFGTLVAAYALRSFAKRSSLQVHTFICAGSVLPRSFDWAALPVSRVVNDCGTSDLPAALGVLLILGIGNAGFAGFDGMTGARLRNRFFRFGHSGFFHGSQGVPTDDFMRSYWLPLLRGSRPIPYHDEREHLRGIHRTWHFMLSGLSRLTFIKYGIYMGFLMLPAGLFAYSYRGGLMQASSEARVVDPTASFLRSSEAYRWWASPAALKNLLAARSVGPFYRIASQGSTPVTLTRFLKSGAIVAVRAGGDVEIVAPDGRRRRIEGPASSRINDVISMEAGALMVGIEGRSACIWDLDGRLRHRVEVFDATVAALSRDGRFMAVGQANGEIVLFNLEDSTRKTIGKPGKALRVVRFSANGMQLLAVAEDGSIQAWSVDGTSIGALPAEEGRPLRLDEDRGGEHIVVTDLGGRDSYIWMRGSASGGFSALEDHITFFDAAFLEGTARIVLAASDGSVRVWDLNSGRQVRSNAHSDWVSAVAAVPGGGFVTGSLDGTAKVFGTVQGESLNLVGHRGFVSSVDVASDGTRVITGSYDGTVRVWDLDDRWQSPTAGRVRLGDTTVFSADTRILYTTREGQGHPMYLGPTVAPMYWHDQQLWQVTLGGLERLILSRQVLRFVRLVASTTDRYLAAIQHLSNVVEVIDLSRGTEPVVLRHEFMPVAAAFAPDERTLVTGAGDRKIRVWSLPAATLVHTWRAHDDMVLSVAFSADGKLLVSASDDKQARIWTLAGKLRAVLRGHTDAVIGAVFSSDGRRVLTGSRDRTARIWDATGRQLQVLDHAGAVIPVAFSKDGDAVLTVAADGTARLWDTSGVELMKIARRGAHVLAAAFSPDGKRVLAAFSDGTVASSIVDGKELLRIAAALGSPGPFSRPSPPGTP
jgi:WD40 repeat protein